MLYSIPQSNSQLTWPNFKYPSDDFDRIWDAVEVGNGLVKVTTDAQTIDTSVPDEPPVAAFQYGITTSKTSEAILLVTDLPPVEVPIYIIMYFSEVNELDSTQTRSFEIYINGKSHFDPIVPVYGSVVEMSITNISASSNTSFSLVATSDSTLPPLINAMEVYYVSGPITDGTESKDGW
ncbi:unnamed protein product [Prunus armeniaca]|uniref:Malectin-like domain-containing protein n=1 Tax=Prunus armeniaca TaxID=36596 RepID=A0A6J5V480_PRUAR|nr:unnamed protein product [Prunus armeniaca]